MTATITITPDGDRYLVRVQAPEAERRRILASLRQGPPPVRFRTARRHPGCVTVAGCHHGALAAWADRESYAGAIVDWARAPELLVAVGEG